MRAPRWLLAAVVAAAALTWPLSHAGTALVVTRDISSPDAIIMLASHEWERLPAAASVARLNPRAILLLTVPAQVTIFNCHRCGERVDWLRVEGVSPDRVRLLEQRTENTFGEAIAARDHAMREPFKRLLVVTSPYHTRRALGAFAAVFRDTGIEVGVAPAAAAQGNPRRWWLHAFDRYYVLYEWAAILKYRVSYGVPVSVRR